MKQYGVMWKAVLAYKPLSNGSVKRMVEMLKKSLAKMVISERQTWDVRLPKSCIRI